MKESADRSADAEETAVRPEDLGSPRGTLAIVIVYGILFALGWLGLYLFKFGAQGAPQP
jgi:hypothetical protein